MKEKLSIVEKEGFKEIFSDIDGESIVINEFMSLVDIVMCILLSFYKVYEEVLGMKIVDSEIFSGVYCWFNVINEIDVVKDLIPFYE